VRLSILYAALFLVAGALLLGLTYGLVASSLPSTTSLSRPTAAQRAKIAAECHQAEQAARAKGAGKTEQQPSTGSCQKLALESAYTATVDQRAQTLHNLLVFSLVGLGVMTVVSCGLGWLVAGRVLRPVSAITGAARRASEQHLGERLSLQGPRDELKELADTFDEMLDRLDVAFAGQRRFIADASHELRTPLTVMRTAIDVTLAKPDRTPEQLETMATKVRRSVDHAERLISSLLTLATSERELTTTEFVDLATVAEDAVDAAGADIVRRGLRMTTSLSPACVSGEPRLLERLVGNLVDNAVRHNLPAGWIDLSTGTRDASAYIEVSNSGPLIDEAVVPSLFEPFWRIDQRTSAADGVGLGLAIVRSIATAHGGTLTAHSRPEGGLTISASLPVNDGDSAPA
jgi:signal transduction histidine kinase